MEKAYVTSRTRFTSFWASHHGTASARRVQKPILSQYFRCSNSAKSTTHPSWPPTQTPGRTSTAPRPTAAAATKAHHPRKPTASQTTTRTPPIKTRPRTTSTPLPTIHRQAATPDSGSPTTQTRGRNISHLTSTPTRNNLAHLPTHPTPLAISSASLRITRRRRTSRV